MSTETKVCRKCGETKEFGGFSPAKRNSDGLASYCKVCCSRQTQEQRRNDPTWPDRQRDNHLRRRYGITLATYQAMLEAQGGVCSICHRPERDGHPLSVEHCHTTHQVRSLACQTCNTMLGMSDDCPDRLRAGAAYIELHASAHRENTHGRRSAPQR